MADPPEGVPPKPRSKQKISQAAKKAAEEDNIFEGIDELIERTYNHPDLSPWHVRQALREIVVYLKERHNANRH